MDAQRVGVPCVLCRFAVSMLRIARAVSRRALGNAKAIFLVDTAHCATALAAWKDTRRMATLPAGAIIIPMPQLSPHMSSGIVAQWLKQPGEEISAYDVIFECETDNMVRKNPQAPNNCANN